MAKLIFHKLVCINQIDTGKLLLSFVLIANVVEKLQDDLSDIHEVALIYLYFYYCIMHFRDVCIYACPIPLVDLFYCL